MGQTRVISFHYTLTNSKGEKLDSSVGGKAFSYMEGAGQIIPGLEAALKTAAKGDKKKVEVPAAQAYGEKFDNRLVKVNPSQLPKEVKIGDRFRGGDEPDSPMFVVVEISKSQITLDGNHPLAGQDLVFDVEIVDVRNATEEEISHGHAHGEHGHSH